MNGLAWNYIEPTPIESSGLVASNIQAAQQGLSNGMAGFQLANDNLLAMEISRRNAQALGLAGLTSNIPNNQVQTNPSVDVNVDTTNPISVTTPNTYTNPVPQVVEPSVVNAPTSQTGTTSRGLARPQTEAAKPYRGMIQNASRTYGVPEDILLAVAQTESNFKPDAKSATGVRGLMQVTQSTYDGLGFKGDRSDPTNSINAGAKLLSQLYKQYGNWEDAFSAYNGGADAVRGMRTGNWGVWSDNPAKQREINQYASRVNSYRTAWNS